MAAMERGGWHIRLTAPLAILVLTAACSSQGSSAPAETSAATSAVETFAVPSSPASNPSSEALPLPTPELEVVQSLRPGRAVRQAWDNYPWGPDDGLACPPPASSPGVERDPAGPGVAVVMGDSLIRESRDALANALSDRDFEVVFICWGGKNLVWGMDQVDNLRALDLLPSCLVVNLGTNDLKGTTAQGLADAVGLSQVSERLTDLLLAVQDVPDVFVVDLAANLALAPSTMGEVDSAPQVWESAVGETGVGAAIPWASVAANGGLIGDDGVHDTVEGQWERAELIADYVARDCQTR